VLIYLVEDILQYRVFLNTEMSSQAPCARRGGGGGGERFIDETSSAATIDCDTWLPEVHFITRRNASGRVLK